MAKDERLAKVIASTDESEVGLKQSLANGVKEMRAKAEKEGMIRKPEPLTNAGLHTHWDQAKETVSLDDLTNLIYDTLFPKVKQMHNVRNDLKNIFGGLINVVTSVGHLTEEYAIADMYPSELDLTDPHYLIFKANFPKIISRLYSNIIARKLKLTLDVKEVQLRFSNPASLIMYLEAAASAVYNAIARVEELETSQMFVDHYAKNKLVNFEAASPEEFAQKMIAAYKSLTVKSRRFNLADNPEKGLRFTTQSDGANLYFLTTPDVSAYLDGTIFPYMFDKYGIDFRKKVLLIDRFPEIWTINVDYTLTEDDEKILSNFDYTMIKDKKILAGTVIQTEWVEAGFAKTLERGKDLTVYEFDNQDFGFIFDGRALKLYANEGAGWMTPQNDGEKLWTHMWYHYSMLKAISPFYNMATFSLKAPPKKPGELDQPTGLRTTSVTANEVVMDWKAVNGAKSYLVFQDPGTLDEAAVLYVETNAATITNEKFAGKTVQFAVKALPETFEGKDNAEKIKNALASEKGSEMSEWIQAVFPAETP